MLQTQGQKANKNGNKYECAIKFLFTVILNIPCYTIQDKIELEKNKSLPLKFLIKQKAYAKHDEVFQWIEQGGELQNNGRMDFVYYFFDKTIGKYCSFNIESKYQQVAGSVVEKLIGTYLNLALDQTASTKYSFLVYHGDYLIQYMKKYKKSCVKKYRNMALNEKRNNPNLKINEVAILSLQEFYDVMMNFLKVNSEKRSLAQELLCRF